MHCRDFLSNVTIVKITIALWWPLLILFFFFLQFNTFQAVIAIDSLSGQSYVLFLYDTIQWTQSAIIGINAGDAKNYFTLPQSGTAELANLETSSNTGLPGMFILSAGNGIVFLIMYKIYPLHDCTRFKTWLVLLICHRQTDSHNKPLPTDIKLDFTHCSCSLSIWAHVF